MSKSNWTDQEDQVLINMAREGYTASQIGDALGRGRNSVIGRIHRKRVIWNTTQAPGGARMPAKLRGPRGPYKKRAQTTVTHSRAAALSIAFNAAATEATDLPSEDNTLGVTLFDLTEQSCRWPLGDPLSPDFRFCGQAKSEPFPYCGQHCRMAYQTPAERTRQREREQQAA